MLFSPVKLLLHWSIDATVKPTLRKCSRGILLGLFRVYNIIDQTQEGLISKVGLAFLIDYPPDIPLDAMNRESGDIILIQWASFLCWLQFIYNMTIN